MAAVTYEAALDALAHRLCERSLRHSEGVAEMAAELAERYGVDREAARVAGLLHDWARDESKADLLAAASRAGVPVTEVDRARPYLLHAAVGAVSVQRTFPGIAPEVVDAIRCHTTGAVEMTDLARIVYLADMMEHGREYEGAVLLRGAADAGETLAALFRRAYAISIEHVIERGQPLHPVTVEVWNALVAPERDVEVVS